MKDIIIIGGYGNGSVIADTIEAINKVNKTWNILGFLNDFKTGNINGYPILGEIDKKTVDKYPEAYFYYTLISVKMNYKFLHKLTNLNIPLRRMATLIHPTAIISRSAKIGYGVSIQPYVCVNANAEIGNCVQIFAQSLIGHDSVINDYAYLANNTCVGAEVILKEGAYLGTNSTTLERIIIGKWSVIGIGSVVIRNIPDYKKAVGNPTKLI